MKSFFLLIAVLLAVVSFADQSNVTILIDPGHGGKDPGHLPLSQTHMQEKDIALEISLKVGNYLTYNL